MSQKKLSMKPPNFDIELLLNNVDFLDSTCSRPYFLGNQC